MLTVQASCGRRLGGGREQRGEVVDRADVVAAHRLVQLMRLGAVEVAVGRDRGGAARRQHLEVGGDHVVGAVALAQRRHQLGADLAQRAGHQDRLHAKPPRGEPRCYAPIIAAIPLDEARQCPSSIGVAGLKPTSATSCVDVGISRGTSPGCSGQEVLLGLAAQRLLDAADEVHQLDGVVVADVVEPVGRRRGRRIGIVAAPFRVRLRRCWSAVRSTPSTMSSM